MAIDPYGGYTQPLGAPYSNAETVTPSDTEDLSDTTLAIYVGATGNVSVVTANGQTVTFEAVPVGILPVRASRVMATNTTASDLVALW